MPESDFPRDHNLYWTSRATKIADDVDLPDVQAVALLDCKALARVPPRRARYDSSRIYVGYKQTCWFQTE